MTGLEKIVEQIKKEAQDASEEKLAQTKKEVEEILEQAKKEREQAMEEGKTEATEEAEQQLIRGQSAAALKERKLLLEAKQEIIAKMIEDALNAMIHLRKREYFELLLRLVEQYALKEKGTMYLSKRDLDRMPESFRNECEKRQISIAKEPAKLTGGFLLSYGDIEENCAFDALLEANKEEIQDKIARLLFS